MVSQQVVPGAPAVRAGVMPPTIVSDDFYSDEATARRREENREKYKPTHQRVTIRRAKLVGNSAGEELFL